MKKYLLFFILSTISFAAFSQNQNEDSTFFIHSISVRPLSLVFAELRATYRYRFNPNNAIELNFAAPISYTDKITKQQIPLSFQFNDGWVEPFTLPTTIGIKYCLIQKKKLGYTQFGFGFNYKWINNAQITFGGGDDGSFDLLFSQKRYEFIFDYTYNIEFKKVFKFFCGVGWRATYNQTDYKDVLNINRLIHYASDATGTYLIANAAKIHNDNGWYLLPSAYLGLTINFNFCKKKIAK